MLTRSALVLCLVLPGVCAAKEPFRFPAARAGTAELKVINHVPVLFVEGVPAEIGAGVGALALKPARRVLSYPRELLDLEDVGNLWAPLLTAGKGMFRQFPDDYAKELEAMATAAGADRDAVIAGNTFFDLKKSFACSAVLVGKGRSATGGPLFGRNLDYPSLGYIHQYSLVTVYRPKGKLAFVSVTFPGLIGVLSGMNEAGLCLGVLEVFDIKAGEPHFDAKGVPYGLCLRRALEQARTIDQAVEVLRSMRRTTCINVAIADRDEVAVLEVTPTKVIRRPPAGGICAATNHFRSAELRPETPINIDRSFERLAALEALRGQKQPADVETLRRQLDAVNLGTVTLQSMIFEPAAGKLHLSVGGVPASRGPLRTLDVSDLLGAQRRR